MQTKEVAQSFWSANPQYSLPEMLSTQEKNDLVDTGTVFDILSIRQITHRQYGPTWVLTVDINGFARSIFLSCNDVRDEMIENMRDYLRHDIAIPAVLTRFLASSGYEAWGIAPPPDAATSLPDVISEIDAGDDDRYYNEG